MLPALLDLSRIRLIHHRHGALRLLLTPGGITQLRKLFDKHSFWAGARSPRQLRRMLRGSDAVVSAWDGHQLVGFGRATSDGVFRAVLWDVVVASSHQGRGLGRQVVESLLEDKRIKQAERVYLMTTNSSGFYKQLGFNRIETQELMLRTNRKI
jgi:ribosomal protein S18 acetylase RimI-like enzyme